MRSVQIILSVLCVGFLLSCSHGGSSKQSGGLRPYRVKTLDNGLKIFYVRDESLPRVSLSFLVKVGLAQESKPGQNHMTALLLEEGTQKKSALQVAEAFGDLGTSLSISPGPDFTTISSDSLSPSKSQLLMLMSEVVQKPAFSEHEIQRLRGQILADLQKKKDNPGGLAEDFFDGFLFGNHPYGRDVMGDNSSVQSLQKKDIIQHYLAWYRPNNTSLAVVGAFDEGFEREVESTLNAWTSRNLPAPRSLAETLETEPGGFKAYLKTGLAQTQIRMGHRGISRNNPDFIPLRVANEILGGGFSSRLMQKVRDDHGLTYSIYSTIEARKEPGYFGIFTFTKNETVAQTVSESQKVLSQFVVDGPSSKEINAAKNQLMGQFPRAIETSDRYAFNLMILDFYGVPASYLTDFRKNVARVSTSDIRRVLQKYYKPDQMKVVIYGDTAIEKQIESFKPQITRLP